MLTKKCILSLSNTGKNCNVIYHPTVSRYYKLMKRTHITAMATLLAEASRKRLPKISWCKTAKSKRMTKPQTNEISQASRRISAAPMRAKKQPVFLN